MYQGLAATIVYALQAGSFLVGVTYFAGVIVNYMKMDEVRGTWVESHFLWQIRTFWFSILWGLIGVITMFFMIGHAILFADMLWVVYRIVYGSFCCDCLSDLYSEYGTR